jgi:hypothetical protein
MEARALFFIFFGLIIGGVLFEVVLSQAHYFLTKKHYKQYQYSFDRYLFLLLFPLTATFFIASQVGFTLFYVFLAFMIVGSILEWLVGFSYHMVVGQRLWTYHRYGITTYTSLLSLPLWGFAGVLFWLLARVFV